MRERKVQRIMQNTRQMLCRSLNKPWGTFCIAHIEPQYVSEASSDWLKQHNWSFRSEFLRAIGRLGKYLGDS